MDDKLRNDCLTELNVKNKRDSDFVKVHTALRKYSKSAIL